MTKSSYYIIPFTIYILIANSLIVCQCIEINNEKSKLKIAIFGDTRNPINIEKLLRTTSNIKVNHISRYLTFLNPDILLHTGDIVKFGSKTSDWKFFRRYFNKFINYDKYPVFYPVLGNHDLNFIEAVGLQNYFETFPYLQGERWYCVSINKDILILNLDSNFKELSGEETSRQNEFIKTTIERYSNKFKLLLVNFHHPVYKNIKTLKMREGFVKNWQKIFEKVDKCTFFINGHFHNFFYRKVKPKFILIITGGGGAPLHTFVPELLNKHHIGILKIDLLKRLIKIRLLIFNSPRRFYFKTIDSIKY